MDMIERIARVLAGQHFSRNAAGAAPEGEHASELVDIQWRDFVPDAVAVLKTMREPDDAMKAADPSGHWNTMIGAALDNESQGTL